MSAHSSERPGRDDGRPDPETLLKRYNLRDKDGQADVAAPSTSESEDEDDRQHDTSAGGRLRVYLGAAAGAGKTYAMLNEGNRRKERGTDVVVGYVETHKRAHTETQLQDLEVIPRKKIDYRGVTLERNGHRSDYCTPSSGCAR